MPNWNRSSVRVNLGRILARDPRVGVHEAVSHVRDATGHELSPGTVSIYRLGRARRAFGERLTRLSSETLRIVRAYLDPDGKSIQAIARETESTKQEVRKVASSVRTWLGPGIKRARSKGGGPEQSRSAASGNRGKVAPRSTPSGRSRRPHKQGDIERLVVEKWGDEGDPMGWTDGGMVVFVQGGQLGDKVRVRLTDVQETYAFGEIVGYLN